MSDIPISIGLISFINCLPFNYPLEIWHNNRLIQTSGYPTMINDLFAFEQLHVAPISSFEYLKKNKEYSVLKKTCIASDGEVGSVLLFSKHKLENLKRCKIGVPYTSATSIALLKVLLSMNGVNIEHCEFIKHKYKNSLDSDLASNFDAILYIGDPALIANYDYTFNDKYQRYLKYDLGLEWKKHTGLPFVFGIWVARSEWKTHQLEDFEWVNYLLDKAVDASFDMYFNEINTKAASTLKLPEDYTEDYFKNKIKYKLDSRCIESLKLFWQKYQLLIKCKN